MLLTIIFILLILIGIRDVLQKSHSITNNFPIIGHFRFIFEKIGPELRQYFFANDWEEKPFDRNERKYVYAASKEEDRNEGFGSKKDMAAQQHFFIGHNMFPKPLLDPKCSELKPTKVIGSQREKPYLPGSIINISGMSWGALSDNSVEAMNLGAKLAGCYQTTGEGGLSPFHKSGADIVFQFGTGYNGVRNTDGTFSIDKLVDLVEKNPFIKMIEIKLHQGAKPGAWGMLPASKMTPQIAAVRGLKPGEDSISPGHHSAFSNVDELLHFVEWIAGATGLPVGIKCAVGQLKEWEELARKMSTLKIGPDYIVIDGGEGGTGSAKSSYTDHMGLPFVPAFMAVRKIFKAEGIFDKITWIGSGKLGFPAKAIYAMALDVDMINVARTVLFSTGCIQAGICNTNLCPTGNTTNNRWLTSGLDPNLKSVRVANYIRTFRHDIIGMTVAAGYSHPSEFTMKDISVNTSDKNQLLELTELYKQIKNQPTK